MGKIAVKKGAAPTKGSVKKDAKQKAYAHVNATETRLIQNMAKAGVTWTKIHEITGRGNGAIAAALKKAEASPTRAVAKVGRPVAITPRTFKLIEKALGQLLKEAGGLTEVTATMIKVRAGVVASDKALGEALRKHGVFFRKLTEKLFLNKLDIQKRYRWGKKRMYRSKVGWDSKPHAIVDNKK
jgi:hypothetical protein